MNLKQNNLVRRPREWESKVGMSGHFIEKCSCGKIISQCRCPDPSKPVRIVEHGCEDCKKKKVGTRLTDKIPWNNQKCGECNLSVELHDETAGHKFVNTLENWTAANNFNLNKQKTPK